MEREKVKEGIKGIGTLILGIVILVGIIVLVWGLLYGIPLISLRIYPVTQVLAFICFIVSLIILPLTIFKKLRYIVGNSIFITSYIIGLNLWIYSVLVAYSLWGSTGLFVGLFLLGIGIIPVAFLASIFSGEWWALGNVLFGIFLTFGSRSLGLYILSKHEEIESVLLFICPACGPENTANTAVCICGKEL